MDRFFSYCPDCGFETHTTSEEARDSADAHLDHFRDYACDGWNDDVTQICWGEIRETVDETERRPYNPETDYMIDPECECVVDYGLMPFPETEVG